MLDVLAHNFYHTQGPKSSVRNKFEPTLDFIRYSQQSTLSFGATANLNVRHCMCTTSSGFYSDLYIHVFLLLLLLMMSLFLILSVTLFFTLIAFRPQATLHKHLNCLYLLQDSIYVGRQYDFAIILILFHIMI